MVYCVGHRLSFKAERVAALLRLSAAEGIPLVAEEVSAVELHAGTVGKDLHHYASVGRSNRGPLLYALSPVGKYEAMVNAAADNDILVIVRLKSLGNKLFLGEIKGSSLYGLYLARGDKGVVGGKVSVGVDKYLMRADISLAREVEVRVVGKVEYGLLSVVAR